MAWSLQRKVSKKSGCEDFSGQISTNENSNRAVPELRKDERLYAFGG